MIDRMNLIQRGKDDQAYFENTAITVFSMALLEESQSNRIDVVVDTYRKNSMKNREISMRWRDYTPVAGYYRHTDCEIVEEFPNKGQ